MKLRYPYGLGINIKSIKKKNWILPHEIKNKEKDKIFPPTTNFMILYINCKMYLTTTIIKIEKEIVCDVNKINLPRN